MWYDDRKRDKAANNKCREAGEVYQTGLVLGREPMVLSISQYILLNTKGILFMQQNVAVKTY